MILSIVLFLAAIICYSIQQLQQHKKLIGQKNDMGFWGENSYLRKYNYDWLGVPQPTGWYYKFFNIRYKERFPLSATLLVFLTDGYHLMQFFFKLLFCSAFYPLTNWWFCVILWVVWGVTFTLCDKYFTK